MATRMNIYDAVWKRVTKQEPCPVCSSSSWCCVGKIFIHCMRVESNHPAKGDTGGWMHRIKDPVPVVARRQPEPPPQKIDAFRMWLDWRSETEPNQIKKLAKALGIHPSGLYLIGCAWAPEHRAFAFPMYDGSGKVVGIRFRNLDGQKWSVKGSHAGIFMCPAGMTGETLLIVEGATDAAAALSLCCSVIGRPSCLGTHEAVIQTIKRLRKRRAIIVPDNDEPGIRGAEKLQVDLPIPTAFLIPPAKDLREFVNNGGTREVFNAICKDLVWTMPKIK